MVGSKFNCSSRYQFVLCPRLPAVHCFGRSGTPTKVGNLASEATGSRACALCCHEHCQAGARHFTADQGRLLWSSDCSLSVSLPANVGLYIQQELCAGHVPLVQLNAFEQEVSELLHAFESEVCMLCLCVAFCDAETSGGSGTHVKV